MSIEIGLIQSKIRFTHKDTQPDLALFPRIRFAFEVSHSQASYTLLLEIVSMDLTIVSREGAARHLGRLIPSQPFLMIGANTNQTVNCFLQLDYPTLSQVEKVREGRDLAMTLTVNLVGEQQGAPQTRQNNSATFDLRIPKSDWVEGMLPNIGFKDVSLIEIPRLAGQDYSDVIGYQNEAWKQYMMGEYDKVLTECRKTLEALSSHVKDKGLEKETNGKKVPDWEKLLGDNDSGDIVGAVYSKMKGYVAPGSHAGRSSTREDSEFALMVTHAIANLVLKKLANIP